jgi:hypothetical protein
MNEETNNEELNRPLNINGFLVVKNPDPIKDVNYEGIYGISWPLEDFKELANSEVYNNLNIISAPDAAHVATDWDSTLIYWHICSDMGFISRLLMIETELSWPIIKPQNNVLWEFIGYDVAWAEGDLYSAIHQELFMIKVPDLLEWVGKLNNHGLFPDIHTANSYKNTRKLVKEGIEPFGNFFIIRVNKFVGIKK